MIYYPKEIYLKEDEFVPASRSNWQEVPFQKQTKEYQGRTYQVLKVTERFLSASERIESGLKALIAVVSTLGLALIFSSTVRDLCLSAINGKEKEIYWKPLPKADAFGLYKLSFDQGLILSQLDNQEKTALSDLISKWKERATNQTTWILPELATLLKQEPSTLQKLFNLVYLIPHSITGYSTLALDKLFTSLENSLSETLSISFHAGVVVIWEGKSTVQGLHFSQGTARKNWTLVDLSRFLAVSQKALIQFLGEEKESYSYQEIDKAFKTVGNRTINTVLEANRTQKGSIRWGMFAG